MLREMQTVYSLSASLTAWLNKSVLKHHFNGLDVLWCSFYFKALKKETCQPLTVCKGEAKTDRATDNGVFLGEMFCPSVLSSAGKEAKIESNRQCNFSFSPSFLSSLCSVGGLLFLLSHSCTRVSLQANHVNSSKLSGSILCCHMWPTFTSQCVQWWIVTWEQSYQKVATNFSLSTSNHFQPVLVV